MADETKKFTETPGTALAMRLVTDILITLQAQGLLNKEAISAMMSDALEDLIAHRPADEKVLLEIAADVQTAVGLTALSLERQSAQKKP
jgi:hypothetical protein